MTTITFDTLAYSQTLQKAGIAREQADAMAHANADALKEMVKSQQLATKQDLAAAKHDLEIALEKTRNEIIKWTVTMIAAQATLTLTAIGIAVALLK